MPQTTFDGKAAARPPRMNLTLALFALLGCAALAASARPALAQSLNAGSPDLVISQVYTRGGEPGATWRNDYVEIFNRGATTVNLVDYSVQALVVAQPQLGFPGGLTSVTTRFVSSSGAVLLEPGKYRLLAYGSSGNNGAPLPGVFFTSPDFNMQATFGRVAIVRGTAALGQFGCPVGTDAALVDFFSYGTATCAEGPAVFAAPTQTTAAFRNSDGCADTDSNVTDFTAAAANPRTDSTPSDPCVLPAPANAVQFETASASVGENAGSAEIFVTRTGDTSAAASVQYATSDDSFGTSDRNDYTTTFGTLDFAPGEARKSFRVLITDDVRAEGGAESLILGLANPSGAALGAAHIFELTINDDDEGGAPNPIDVTGFFVRQHYADFLGRDPDASGFNFWTGEIEGCGADAQCREVKRINVSAAFFLSIEFQTTGDFAYRAHKASYPDSFAFRPRGFPTYRELWRDTRQLADGVVVGEPGAEQRLGENREAYTLEFVTRPEFLIRYPATRTPEQFVDALLTNAGNPLTPAERDAQVTALTAAGNTAGGRADVLEAVIESDAFRAAERNRSFVLMEYFGYLRRNPYDQPEPNLNFVGYDFWLGKLNEAGGDYIASEMVKAFISSDEYRNRFGQ